MNIRSLIRTIIEESIDTTLEQLVTKFRHNQEEMYEWGSDDTLDSKECFKGLCQGIAKELVEFLKKHGISSERAMGYYSGFNNRYEPNMDEWDYDDIEAWNNGDMDEVTHFWVETKYNIIDVTADQFHPGEEDDYRVVITKLNDKNYRSL